MRDVRGVCQVGKTTRAAWNEARDRLTVDQHFVFEGPLNPPIGLVQFFVAEGYLVELEFDGLRGGLDDSAILTRVIERK
jgi:hypothetical protein